MAEAFSPEMERLYDQSVWAPNMQEVLARYRVASDATRAALGPPQRVAYGSGQHEGLDVFRTRHERAPTVVFVHGGAWRGGAAHDYAFPAEMLVAAGINYIAVDFATAADAKGDLGMLVDQVRRAVIWARQNGQTFGGDPARLYVAGHSTGAHLAAMALSTRWTEQALSGNPIRGGLLVSGTYDLGPLRRTSRTTYLNLDDDVERRLSPLHQTAHLSSPLFLAVGSKESPEIVRQARAYTDAVVQAGKQAQLVVSDTHTHFDILETLGSPDGLLGRALLDFVQR